MRRNGRADEVGPRTVGTPYGVEKLAPPIPPCARMWAGSPEASGDGRNGAVYKPCAAFYMYGLYAVGEQDHAYRLLRKMLPGPDIEDIIRRGQLPCSSLTITGALQAVPADCRTLQPSVQRRTVPWVYRCSDGRTVRPARLPGRTPGEAAASFRLAGGNREAQLQRRELQIEMKRESGVSGNRSISGRQLGGRRCEGVKPDKKIRCWLRFRQLIRRNKEGRGSYPANTIGYYDRGGCNSYDESYSGSTAE